MVGPSGKKRSVLYRVTPHYYVYLLYYNTSWGHPSGHPWGHPGGHPAGHPWGHPGGHPDRTSRQSESRTSVGHPALGVSAYWSKEFR